MRGWWWWREQVCEKNKQAGDHHDNRTDAQAKNDPRGAGGALHEGYDEFSFSFSVSLWNNHVVKQQQAIEGSLPLSLI